ncbi:MAG TPA: hypothetical protein VF552_14160, partial [Allosphingosinicella sp.]
MIRTLIAAAALLLAAPGGEARAHAPQSAEVTAIVGADVLPMTGRAERLRDQTVVLRGGRIESVGPRARVRVPVGARRIE